MLNKSTVKYIQSLSTKKFRNEYHRFVAEGPKVVNELLLQGYFTCESIFATSEWIENIPAEIKDKYSSRVNVVERFELEKISSLPSPNMVLAVFETSPGVSGIESNGRITIVLDQVQDPGNLGTIIRIADWFGIEQIVCSPGTADLYNPKVVQSTMASLGRVKLFYCDIAQWLSSTPVKKYAATLDGKDISSIGKISEAVLLIGNESRGIRQELLELVDEKVTIPRRGSAESLNAAVATSIILYALIK